MSALLSWIPNELVKLICMSVAVLVTCCTADYLYVNIHLSTFYSWVLQECTVLQSWCIFKEQMKSGTLSDLSGVKESLLNSLLKKKKGKKLKSNTIFLSLWSNHKNIGLFLKIERIWMIDIIYSNTMIAPCFLCNVSYRFKSSWLKKTKIP